MLLEPSRSSVSGTVKARDITPTFHKAVLVSGDPADGTGADQMGWISLMRSGSDRELGGQAQRIVVDCSKLITPIGCRDGVKRQQVMTLAADELIRRFLLHVLPRGSIVSGITAFSSAIINEHAGVFSDIDAIRIEQIVSTKGICRLAGNLRQRSLSRLRQGKTAKGQRGELPA